MQVRFMKLDGSPMSHEEVAKANGSEVHLYAIGYVIPSPGYSLPSTGDGVQLRDGKWFRVSHIEFPTDRAPRMVLLVGDDGIGVTGMEGL